jgi:hypothetical protein
VIWRYWYWALRAYFAHTGALLGRRLQGSMLLALVLASACGRSTRHDNRAIASNGGVGGDGADAGAGPVSAGNTSGGTHSDAGTSSGGVSVAGAPEVAGEPSVNPGAAGEGGALSAAGGAGGEAGELVPSPICDDGNPCTLDSFDSGSCHHDPAPDGRLCEDGSFCTLGDHCTAGACVPGALQNGPGGALGNLETYGMGLSIAAGDKRFAFVDSPALPARLTLAEVDDAGVLRTQDQLSVDQNVGFSFIGTAWDDLIALADGDTGFGLNGPSRNMQLFSVEADGQLTAHAVVPITPGSQNNPANTSMVGRGSRLFLCHNWGFFSPPAGTLMWWDVSDPDAPVLVAQGSTKGQCGSIVVSEDGERVYVNTVSGVIWTDLSSWISGDLTFAAEPLVPMDAGLSLRGDRLILRSGEDIRVFDESDHSELASFTVVGANGAALTNAGIFVEADGSSPGGTDNGIGLYDLSGNAIQTRWVSKLAYARDLTSQKAVATESYAIDTLTHRLFAIGPNGFEEIEQPQVGALSWAFAGKDALHTRGNMSAHRIDVSDPLAPVILAGGPTREPVLGIKLDVSLTPASLIAETDPSPSFFSGPDPAIVAVNPLLGHATQTLVQTVTADADEHYDAGASFALPGGDATLLSAGDFVYRAAYATTGGVHFQRWQVRDLRAGVTTPVTDVSFDAPAGAAGSTAVRFDVDPSARIAVVMTLGTEAGTPVGKLHWLDLTTEPPTELETSSGNAVGVRVRGDRLVYAENTPTGSRLHFCQRGSDANQVFDVSDRITRLLGFDGTTAYYGLRNALQAVSNKPPAAPALTLDLPMRGTPSSLTAMPGSLVTTSSAQLVTLAPVCN